MPTSREPCNPNPEAMLNLCVCVCVCSFWRGRSWNRHSSSLTDLHLLADPAERLCDASVNARLVPHSTANSPAGRSNQLPHRRVLAGQRTTAVPLRTHTHTHTNTHCHKHCSLLTKHTTDPAQHHKQRTSRRRRDFIIIWEDFCHFLKIKVSYFISVKF